MDWSRFGARLAEFASCTGLVAFGLRWDALCRPLVLTSGVVQVIGATLNCSSSLKVLSSYARAVKQKRQLIEGVPASP